MHSSEPDPPPDQSAPEPGNQQTSATTALDPSCRQRLLEIARHSIIHGLDQGVALRIALDDQPPQLQALRASFVTLHEAGNLRGCIGHLEAISPLAVDVAENAYAAAFQDPRFQPLRRDEFADLHLEVSVLTRPEPLRFDGEPGLLAAIEPGVDGLILTEGSRRGTFLPSVWSQLPTPEAFLRHLKQKAGLAPDHWSPQIKVSRYRTESFGE